MAAYELKGKYAIVTGAGSGIFSALTGMLLEAGCSVILADLKLGPESEAYLTKYPYPHPSPTPGTTPLAVFFKVDLIDWKQIKELWEFSLKTFPQINVVCNGAGIVEPPWSSFWHPPGSPLAGDNEDQCPGVYNIFAVNTMAPIRLAQIAVDYWLKNREVQGNLFWVASMAACKSTDQTWSSSGHSYGVSD